MPAVNARKYMRPENRPPSELATCKHCGNDLREWGHVEFSYTDTRSARIDDSDDTLHIGEEEDYTNQTAVCANCQQPVKYARKEWY